MVRITLRNGGGFFRFVPQNRQFLIAETQRNTARNNLETLRKLHLRLPPSTNDLHVQIVFVVQRRMHRVNIAITHCTDSLGLPKDCQRNVQIVTKQVEDSATALVCLRQPSAPPRIPGAAR